jgi:hypothetical protein
MKVYKSVTFDMWSGEVVDEVSYEYSGPVDLCKGGGASGKVDFPTYMKDIHNEWLNLNDDDEIETSITGAMNSALGSSPYTSFSAYDPDVVLAESAAAVLAFSTLLGSVDEETEWPALFGITKTAVGVETAITSTEISESVIAASVDSFGDSLDYDIDSNILPRFRRGMQDINAVVSSAFPIGESIIETNKLRAIAKYNSDLRLDAAGKNAEIGLRTAIANLEAKKDYGRVYLDGVAQLLQYRMHKINWNLDLLRATIENNRIKIVAKKEQTVDDIELAKNDALWDLQVFQHGGNLLAAISGGTAAVDQGPSKVASAIGGAMSGAAAGAQIGSMINPGVGTAIGAGIGAAAGAIKGALS